MTNATNRRIVITMAAESTRSVFLRLHRLELQISPNATRTPSGRVQNQWMCDIIRRLRGTGFIPISIYICENTGDSNPIRRKTRIQKTLAIHGITMGFFSDIPD